MLNKRRFFAGLPWYPVLLGIFYVLSIYQTNMELQPLYVIWMPLIAFTLFSLSICTLTSLVVRKVRTGCLLGSALILLLLVFPALKSSLPSGWDWNVASVLFVILVILTWAGLIRIPVATRESVTLTRYLNLICACCLVSPLATISGSHLGATSVTSEKGVPALEEWDTLEQSQISSASSKPDIFHIVLDGYARGDTLSRLYGFDNEPFLNKLRQRGFYIADESSANYCQTGLSMSSTLNSHYLDLPPVFLESNNRKILKAAISRSSIGMFLSKCGYRTRIYDSGYYLTDSMFGAERIETASSLWNEFSFEVVRRTVLFLPKELHRKAMASLGNRTLYRQHRSRVVNAFKLLGEERLVSEPPTFTFIHILSPHPPFIFADQSLRETQDLLYGHNDGSHLVSQFKGGENEYRRLYVSQLRAINQMALTAIDRLLNNSSRPVVIILQSDHGPGSKLDWNEVLQSDAAERLGILHAIYCSDSDYSNLYTSISPLNTWRVILNKYLLETPLPLIQDVSYLSSWPKPYVFHKIDQRGTDLTRTSIE